MNNDNRTVEKENEENFVKVSLINQSVTIKRKKTCPLKKLDIKEINYKNLSLIDKFISERGKIVPRRVSNISMKYQRQLTNAIKRARHLGLVSYIAK